MALTLLGGCRRERAWTFALGDSLTQLPDTVLAEAFAGDCGVCPPAGARLYCERLGRGVTGSPPDLDSTGTHCLVGTGFDAQGRPVALGCTEVEIGDGDDAEVVLEATDIERVPSCDGDLPDAGGLDAEVVGLDAGPDAMGPDAGRLDASGADAPPLDGGPSDAFRADSPSRFLLRVVVNGVGWVSSSPGGIDCTAGAPVTCTDAFPPDSDVLLTSTPVFGHFPVGWDFAGCTDPDTCLVEMTADVTVSHRFDNCRNPGGVCGDVDGDFDVNEDDVNYLDEHLRGLRSLTPCRRYWADVADTRAMVNADDLEALEAFVREGTPALVCPPP